jgi:polar amino acid transport system substrate-binding protein
MRKWMVAGLDVPPVAFNISNRQFEVPNLHQIFRGIADRCGVPAFNLEVEITEDVVMEHASHAMQAIMSFQDVGFQVALDDFGMGNSSLNYFRMIPVNHIKIDRSFVHGMEYSNRSASVVKAIVELGHAFSARITGEGIENKHQFDLLRETGCDEAQGFALSMPLPPDEIPDFIRVHVSDPCLHHFPSKKLDILALLLNTPSQ